MKRTIMMIIGGSYAVLLGVIFALSWALYGERHRRRGVLGGIPDSVRREISDLASQAAETAQSLDSFASRGVEEAKSAAQKAVGILH